MTFGAVGRTLSATMVSVRRFFLCSSALALLGAGGAMAADAPVAYEADAASYNQIRQLATLEGNVRLQQDQKIVTANKITYDRLNDVVMAYGNVTLLDDDGSVHKAETLELTDGMKRGLAQRILSVLPNGGRVKADTARRASEKDFSLKQAHYTACEPCERDPEGDKPAWELRARDVEVDDAKKQATYHNAWLSFYGVPVAYTPWFRHSTDNVTQKSGFLTPKAGWNSKLGGFYEQSYYFGLAPDHDATLGVLTSTKEAPVLKGQVRKRYTHGEVKVDASTTRSSRKDDDGVNIVSTNKEWRGHIFGDLKYEVNDMWRTGAQVQLASDAQYLRQYRISSTDVLENKLYAERFSGRDYALAEVLMFQDMRVGTAKVDQPGVLPHLSLSMLGDPGQALGGRLGLEADFLSLFREGNGQDMYRFSTTASWQRRDILPLGFVATSSASVRGDVYKTQDRVAASLDPTKETNNQQGRLFPTAQVKVAYPLEKRLAHSSLRVEPTVALTAVPNINNNDSIPNEDSEDVQLDSSNVFEANRFAGYDRVEDKTHIAYGIGAGYYADNGDQLRVFAGQSHRLGNGGDNPFPQGSGLEDEKSDYVGEITAALDEGRHTLSYKNQFDGETGRSERHEVYAATIVGPVSLGGTYLYTRRVPSAANTVTREQINASSTYQISKQWALRNGINYNLDSTDRGLRNVMGGLDYTHQCYNFSLTVDREVARESSGADQLTVMMRFGLKTLGEFSAGGG